MQSQAQRKHVVASGLLHILHDKPGTTGPRRPDDATDPPEVPGGMGPARVDDMAVDYFDDGSVDLLSVGLESTTRSN